LDFDRSRVAAIRDYRDIIAWQRAIELALAVGSICDALPRRDWELASQMRRAAHSVHSNIAEGNGRGSVADYVRHLFISRASLNELESDLHFLMRRDGERTKAPQTLELALSTRRPLIGLIQSLQRKKRGE
jgi:four helix bundle protein